MKRKKSLISKLDRNRFVSNNISHLNTIVESERRESKLNHAGSMTQLHRTLTSSLTNNWNADGQEKRQPKQTKEVEEYRRKLRAEFDILKMFLGIDINLETLLQPEITELYNSKNNPENIKFHNVILVIWY